MARKNIFPVILEGTQTVTTNADWDGVSGRVTLTSTGDLTLDSADYTDVPEGAVVFIHNKYLGENTVTFTTDLQGDADSDFLYLEAGAMVTLCYTSEFGWFVLGYIGAANPTALTTIGGLS